MSSIAPIFAPSSRNEIAGRITRLREAMERHGIDCYICIHTDNVFYLTNFANYVHERPFVLLITKQGPLRFLIPKLEGSHVEMRAVGDIELVTYFEFPAPEGERWSDRLGEIIPQGAKIGIESTCPMFLAQVAGRDAVVEDLIDDQRMVKSPFELARIQHASNLASRAHGELLAAARPGINLAFANGDVGRKVMGQLLAEDPTINLFATKVAFGFQPPSISWDPHNFTDLSMATEEGGPNVSLLNGVMNGYGTEIERTFFLGHVPEAAKRPFDTMLEARRVALDAARPGTLMSEVDRRANDVFRKAGYADYMLHRTGHGIGVTGHEGPFFAEGFDREIEPGMVFTIEPGIYVPGLGGFRHSDTIRIDAAGPVLMTEGAISREELTLAI